MFGNFAGLGLEMDYSHTQPRLRMFLHETLLIDLSDCRRHGFRRSRRDHNLAGISRAELLGCLGPGQTTGQNWSH